MRETTEFYVLRRECCPACEGLGATYEPFSDRQLKVITCQVCKGHPITESFVLLSEALKQLVREAE